METNIIGLDIAKNFFQVHAIDTSGGVVERRKLRRAQVMSYFSGLKRCIVALEACGTAHYWGRALSALGFEVRLVPPSYVKAYVKRGKNDAVDAEAICEAASRPSMRFVPVKGEAQQVSLSRHRTREMLVKQRTMLINTLRAQLAEFGFISAQGHSGLKRLLAIVADKAALPDGLYEVVSELIQAIDPLEVRIDRLEKAIRSEVRSNAVAKRLMSIPGIGPITASAFVASVGDPAAFENGRHFSAWLGLVAKQNSTGGKTRLGHISKMGDRYLRKLLVLGATSRLRYAANGATPLDDWTCRLLEHKKKRLVSVALANKTARIVWAVMVSGEPYDPARAAA